MPVTKVSLNNLKPNKPTGEKALSRSAIAVKVEDKYYQMYKQLSPKTRGSLIRKVVQEAIKNEIEKGLESA